MQRAVTCTAYVVTMATHMTRILRQCIVLRYIINDVFITILINHNPHTNGTKYLGENTGMWCSLCDVVLEVRPTI